LAKTSAPWRGLGCSTWALGNIRTLPEVYRVAGSSLIFDEQPMRELIGLVERQHLALCRTGSSVFRLPP
jgi:hypothetical protein